MRKAGKRRRTSKRRARKQRVQIDWTGHLPEEFSENVRSIYTFIVRDALSNLEIAERLPITRRTVRFHVSSLLREFGFEYREQLIAHFWNLQSDASPTPPESLRFDANVTRTYQLLYKGFDNTQIAKQIGTSHRNVRFWVSKVLQDTGHENRCQLIATIGRQLLGVQKSPPYRPRPTPSTAVSRSLASRALSLNGGDVAAAAAQFGCSTSVLRARLRTLGIDPKYYQHDHLLSLLQRFDGDEKDAFDVVRDVANQLGITSERMVARLKSLGLFPDDDPPDPSDLSQHQVRRLLNQHHGNVSSIADELCSTQSAVRRRLKALELEPRLYDPTYLKRMLKKHGGNQNRTATALKISPASLMARIAR